MQNGFCESFNGRTRDELLNETLFFGLDHARTTIAEWADDYNRSRPHSALGYITPAAYAANLTATGDRLRNPDQLRRSPVAQPAPLRRTTRRGSNLPSHAVLLCPGEHGVRGELGAVVGDDHARLAAVGDQFGQFACYTAARDRGVRDCRQALARHVVDDVEDAEASTAGELVVDETQRPAGVRPCLDQNRCAGANRAPA
ncbi:hypothetical protein X737_31230 [Mesorhizobium sp. L48C026A00]|nr:hypothetical protein X737_31230 [Mesorhizobium sp. L48C026A00]